MIYLCVCLLVCVRTYCFAYQTKIVYKHKNKFTFNTFKIQLNLNTFSSSSPFSPSPSPSPGTCACFIIHHHHQSHFLSSLSVSIWNSEYFSSCELSHTFVFNEKWWLRWNVFHFILFLSSSTSFLVIVFSVWSNICCCLCLSLSNKWTENNQKIENRISQVCMRMRWSFSLKIIDFS